MNKRIIAVILMIFLSSVMAVNAISVVGNVENVTVDVVNVSDGEPFKNKATELVNGDSVICFCEYRDNVQYSKGVHIDHWYVGENEEDIDPHSTRLVKAELFYKSADGRTISKVLNATEGFIDAFPLIDGYNAYRAVVWYEKI